MQQTEPWANSSARRNRPIYWDSGDCNTRLSEGHGTAACDLGVPQLSPHVAPSAGHWTRPCGPAQTFTGTQETCREQPRAEQVLSLVIFGGGTEQFLAIQGEERLRGQSECSGWDVGEKTPGPNPLLVLVLVGSRDPQLAQRLGHARRKRVPTTCTTSTLDVAGGSFIFLFLETSPDDSHMQPCGTYYSHPPAHGFPAEVAGPSPIQEELATALLTQGYHPTDRRICYSSPMPPSHCYH